MMEKVDLIFLKCKFGFVLYLQSKGFLYFRSFALIVVCIAKKRAHILGSSALVSFMKTLILYLFHSIIFNVYENI